MVVPNRPATFSKYDMPIPLTLIQPDGIRQKEICELTTNYQPTN